MPELSIRQMFEAGAHFGHQTRFWNPEITPYIYGERNKIHIINLDAALPMLRTALDYLRSLSASGGKVLFVGTKRAARESIVKNAERCNMPYVNHRWLGGMMTNFKTIRLSIKRYTELQEQQQQQQQHDLGLKKMTKKQILQRSREIIKLGRNFQGIKDMSRLPEALFIIDVGHEKIAVNEAVKVGVPVVAVVDTNGSCDGIDYVIPGNDDAIRAIDLYVTAAADAIFEGTRMRKQEEELAEIESRETLKGVITVASGDAAPSKAASASEEKLPRIRVKNLSPRRAQELGAGVLAGQEEPGAREENTSAAPGGGEKGATEGASEAATEGAPDVATETPGDTGEGQAPGEK